ncbi:hypothetical protein NC653_020952 [Populus alba x Populus x berolinensis]|uniref:Uncharacterized protein n=1 Tax=Populus alba x Populus x berolinensis TaxID=444605 RepID=A0AAD6QD79_9ROSI|nr:hypothetical protein NC653_020952 [Populus alba x Populus x berolinensis]
MAREEESLSERNTRSLSFVKLMLVNRCWEDYREIFTPGTSSWRRMDASLPLEITSTNAHRVKTFGPSRTAKIRYGSKSLFTFDDNWIRLQRPFPVRSIHTGGILLVPLLELSETSWDLYYDMTENFQGSRGLMNSMIQACRSL